MVSNALTEFSSYPIILERVTNLNTQHADLVHCSICCHILWKPVTCSLCENSFCSQCIQLWLFGQQERIIEQIEYETDNLIEPFSLIRCPFNCLPYKERKCPPLLILILSKLRIECRNKSYGCQEILFYEQLEKHEDQFCQYKIVQCSGCQQEMFKEMFDKDEHLLKCLYIELQCTKCQSIFKRKDKHNEFDCMEKQIDLLKQYILTIEQKFAKVFDIQRQKNDIIDQKISIIEEIWGTDDDTDDDKQTGKKINSVPISIQLLSFQFMEKWKIIGIGLIILFIFTLLIHIRILLH